MGVGAIGVERGLQKTCRSSSEDCLDFVEREERGKEAVQPIGTKNFDLLKVKNDDLISTLIARLAQWTRRSTTNREIVGSIPMLGEFFLPGSGTNLAQPQKSRFFDLRELGTFFLGTSDFYEFKVRRNPLHTHERKK